MVRSNHSRRRVGKTSAGMIISRSAKAQAIALAYERAEVLWVGEVYVIGGGEVFEEFLADADSMLLTLVEGKFGGNVFLPESSDEDWEEVLHTRPALHEGDGSSYEVMELRRWRSVRLGVVVQVNAGMFLKPGMCSRSALREHMISRFHHIKSSG